VAVKLGRGGVGAARVACNGPRAGSWFEDCGCCIPDELPLARLGDLLYGAPPLISDDGSWAGAVSCLIIFGRGGNPSYEEDGIGPDLPLRDEEEDDGGKPG
jgi:hypothetical protein